MSKTILAAMMAASMLVPSMAFAQAAPTAEQCNAWLEKADTNKDGSIGNNEDAKKYAEMITKAGVTGMGEDAVVPKDMFLEQCAKGTFGMPTP